MLPTVHLGFGIFRLEDLLPGEEFNRFDGTYGSVVERQPPNLGGDLIQVWVGFGSNMEKRLLHRTAQVYGTSPEHARRIERRIAARKRRRQRTEANGGT